LYDQYIGHALITEERDHPNHTNTLTKSVQTHSRHKYGSGMRPLTSRSLYVWLLGFIFLSMHTQADAFGPFASDCRDEIQH
jgi:hypothetical protein